MLCCLFCFFTNQWIRFLCTFIITLENNTSKEKYEIWDESSWTHRGSRSDSKTSSWWRVSTFHSLKIYKDGGWSSARLSFYFLYFVPFSTTLFLHLYSHFFCMSFLLCSLSSSLSPYSLSVSLTLSSPSPSLQRSLSHPTCYSLFASLPSLLYSHSSSLFVGTVLERDMAKSMWTQNSSLALDLTRGNLHAAIIQWHFILFFIGLFKRDSFSLVAPGQMLKRH